MGPQHKNAENFCFLPIDSAVHTLLSGMYTDSGGSLRMYTDSSGSLRIMSANEGDEGDYTCEADNGVNDAIIKSISVNVNGKPPPPMRTLH